MYYILHKSEPNTVLFYALRSITESEFRKLSYHDYHKLNTFTVSKKILEREFNINIDIEFEKDQDPEPELQPQPQLILMKEFTLKQVDDYLKIFADTNESIDSYISLLGTIRFNQQNPFRFQTVNLLNNKLEPITEYWSNPYNSKLNTNRNFIARKFNNLKSEKNIDDLNQIIQMSLNTVDKNQDMDEDTNNYNTNYVEEIISNESTSDTRTKYYLSPPSNLTDSDIMEIYCQIPTDYLKYKFITCMLCSRTNCHLILNNCRILELITPMIEKHKIIFKYVLGYAWLTLKTEENHIFNKINDNSRLVFDIRTACQLPVFPFTHHDINQNPYAGVCVNSKLLNLPSNCLSMEMLEDYEKYYGICDLEEFTRRINIFVNGTNEKGVLDCVDWSCCVITGSTMTACGMKRNPLMDLFIGDGSDIITDDVIKNYFDYHYSKSDIDLLCNTDSIYEFIDVVKNFVLAVKQKYGLDSNSIRTENIHTASMLVTDKYLLLEIKNIRKYLLARNKITQEQVSNITLEFLKSNLTSDVVRDYFYDTYYVDWKISHREKNGFTSSNEYLEEYCKSIPRDEFRLYQSDLEVNIEKYKTRDYEKYFVQDSIIIGKLSESIRYKVDTGLPNVKVFEIFKTKDENFFSVISKFHLGIVRAYWNGRTMKCLPSYISTMMLQLSLDYKYFASIRNPIEIIDKNRSRGYGTILNFNEKVHMVKFNCNSENKKWADMYKINLKDKESVKGVFGTKKSTDAIFKPLDFEEGVRVQIPNLNPKHKTLGTFEECFESMKTKSIIMNYILDKKVIDDNGDIEPLDKNLIELAWTNNH